MKHFTIKWLKRFYILVAVKLVIFAVLLSSARILFISVTDYKERAIDWLATEYQVNIAVEDISAGIDFSGMVLTLNKIKLLDSDQLPFALTLDHLFLHLDFWDSVTEQQLIFKRISLQGADLNFKASQHPINAEQSSLTTQKLKNIFLNQLQKFSIKDSRINFFGQFGVHKTIVIDRLRWLNEGEHHQGVGNASFPNTLGGNTLNFVVDVFSEDITDPLQGNLYLQANNINVTDYLLDSVNPDVQIIDAAVDFEAWAQFSLGKIKQIQLKMNQSKLVWSQLERFHSWQIERGLLQLTNSENGWLLDSYDVDISNNQVEREAIKISGQGDNNHAEFNISGVSIKDILPFYLLNPSLSSAQILAIRSYDLDANIEQIGFSRDSDNEIQFSATLNALKNRPKGGIPGISNANIKLSGNLKAGQLLVSLPSQKIYFDGQFSQPMQLKPSFIPLQWQQSETGLKLFSEQAQLNTNELETISEFSIFLPNEKASNQSAFLSLYSYASLNDASKAQYYFPIKAMGQDVYDYLLPTLKKGHVNGAKILWYGAFNHYPYAENNGIFQAWVPLKEAQYDFYGQWQGLSDLDLDLLFENDFLLMDAKKASLGDVNISKLSAKVDHLNPDGILTVEADISDDAKKISDYLKTSPLKESVGTALTVIDLQQPLSGNITLTIPFNREKLKTRSEGEIQLKNNSINISLADDLILPLTAVNGIIRFENGDLTADNLTAALFKQPLNIAFESKEKEKSYQIDADIKGLWEIEKLSEYHPILSPLQLSGHLDWSGKIDFTHLYAGGYLFNVALNSATQGISSKLPAPFDKNALQAWPTDVVISGNDKNSKMRLSVKDKLAFEGQFNYADGKQSIPYFNLNIGQAELANIDKNKQIININLETFNVNSWYEHWLNEKNAKKIAGQPKKTEVPNALLAINEINVDIKHLDLFKQPLTIFKANAVNLDGRWEAKISSDKLQTRVEYQSGVPDRIDINVKKINFQSLDLSLLDTNSNTLQSREKNVSENMREDYPEIFVDCESCIYEEFDLSPLSLHLFPNKKRLIIDYLKVGGGSEFANLSGFWDQRRTNVIFDSEADKNNSIIKRLGFTSPVSYQNAQISGALNWVGAPWNANVASLNGAFSAELKNGAITEVSDKGARLLSIFSLDGIRRSLNLEFGNVFAKGFNFDQLTLSGNIDDGVVSNDDFFLDGAAGKITGNGLVDLPNQDTNYKFSYSPAVTSSLPVLAAFAINPLTGAAVLMLTKILEPVVETIIRVDFTVKGKLSAPEVEVVTRERGRIKLENSEVLEVMTEQQKVLDQQGLLQGVGSAK